MIVTSASLLVCLLLLNLKISSYSIRAARSFGKPSPPVPMEGNDIDVIPLSSAFFRQSLKIPLKVWKPEHQMLLHLQIKQS